MMISEPKNEDFSMCLKYVAGGMIVFAIAHTDLHGRHDPHLHHPEQPTSIVSSSPAWNVSSRAWNSLVSSRTLDGTVVIAIPSDAPKGPPYTLFEYLPVG